MLHKIAFVLLVIGGLNWLLEAFHYGVGNWLPWNVAMVLYILVGLSAVVEIFGHKKNCMCCAPKAGGQM